MKGNSGSYMTWAKANIARWIELGFIKDYKGLKEALTKVYYKKYPDVLPL
ncbi:hypothetical protein NXW84_21705 [Bacteroides fragilis]|nr:hypothetical protein NXW84_21705 [Bacteroides fragilis]